MRSVLIGYSNVKKGYKLYRLDNKISFFSKDVKLYETVSPYKRASKYDDGSMFPDASLSGNSKP